MGAGLCLPNTTPETGVATIVESAVKDTVESDDSQFPRPLGTEGLPTFGLEYRLVPCYRHDGKGDEEVCWECRHLLFDVATDTMVTFDNRKQFIRDGRQFDEVGTCCQEVIQECLIQDHDMKLVSIEDEGSRPIQALVSCNIESDEGLPLLIVMAGRGKSRAGILSVKHVMVSGIEQGSALFHIKMARRRGWKLLLLDPNVYPNAGMEVVNRTFDHLLPKLANSTFVSLLAHSAAGGSLVRYLHEGVERRILRKMLDKLVFTDSTHNLQWISDDSKLCHFLQSKRALYIRNCSENPSDTFSSHRDKPAGEVCEGNVWWKRRFGEIPTVWAGTVDHSYMCWAARHVIWEFFDKKEANGNLLC